MRRISVRFPEELLEEIDTIAKLEYIDRTALMKRVLQQYIQEQLKTEDLKELAVKRYLEGKLDYKKLETLLGKESAEATRVSKEIMDKGKKIAKKIAKNSS